MQTSLFAEENTEMKDFIKLSLSFHYGVKSECVERFNELIERYRNAPQTDRVKARIEKYRLAVSMLNNEI